MIALEPAKKSLLSTVFRAIIYETRPHVDKPLNRTEITTVFNPSDILTPDELAARLKVKRTWIYKRMRQRNSGNPLPGLKLGKYWRFHWPSVCEWLQKQSAGNNRN
jgi:predicted DNA-binding transcriptional regulator AlpA